MVENMTYLQTTTYVSTATATQTVSETGLSDCLGQVSWDCVDTSVSQPLLTAVTV